MARGIDVHNRTSSVVVLDLWVGEGILAAAQAVTVASQEFAWHVSNPDPGAVIAALCRELVAATDTDRRYPLSGDCVLWTA